MMAEIISWPICNQSKRTGQGIKLMLYSLSIDVRPLIYAASPGPGQSLFRENVTGDII